MNYILGKRKKVTTPKKGTTPLVMFKKKVKSEDANSTSNTSAFVLDKDESSDDSRLLIVDSENASEDVENVKSIEKDSEMNKNKVKHCLKSFQTI